MLKSTAKKVEQAKGGTVSVSDKGKCVTAADTSGSLNLSSDQSKKGVLLGDYARAALVAVAARMRGIKSFSGYLFAYLIIRLRTMKNATK